MCASRKKYDGIVTKGRKVGQMPMFRHNDPRKREEQRRSSVARKRCDGDGLPLRPFECYGARARRLQGRWNAYSTAVGMRSPRYPNPTRLLPRVVRAELPGAPVRDDGVARLLSALCKHP